MSVLFLSMTASIGGESQGDGEGGEEKEKAEAGGGRGSGGDDGEDNPGQFYEDRRGSPYSVHSSGCNRGLYSSTELECL